MSGTKICEQGCFREGIVASEMEPYDSFEQHNRDPLACQEVCQGQLGCRFFTVAVHAEPNKPNDHYYECKIYRSNQ